jgi:hypothetical protein
MQHLNTTIMILELKFRLLNAYFRFFNLQKYIFSGSGLFRRRSFRRGSFRRGSFRRAHFVAGHFVADHFVAELFRQQHSQKHNERIKNVLNSRLENPKNETLEYIAQNLTLDWSFFFNFLFITISILFFPIFCILLLYFFYNKLTHWKLLFYPSKKFSIRIK